MSQKPLTTAEHLALAVLRGDLTAIGPMVDYLSEHYGSGGRPITPLANTSLATVQRGRLRAIFFVRDDVTIDQASLESAYFNWLYYQEPLTLYGIDRIEFYEMPEWVAEIALNTGTATPDIPGPFRPTPE